MLDERLAKKQDEKKKQDDKNDEIIKPGEIKGKIEVADTRERRDGPGGN